METRLLNRLVAGLLLGLSLSSCGSDGDDQDGGGSLDKSWSQPVQIGSNASTTEIYNLSLAAAARGDAMAVWVQGLGQVTAARFTPGGGWEAEVAIGTTNEQSQHSSTTIPDVSMDSSGNAIAVWAEHRFGTQSGVFANRYVAGTGWGAATRIWVSTDRSKAPSQAQIAMNPGGAAVALWTQGRDAYTSRFQPGSNWTNAVSVSPSVGYNLLHAVAIDDNGNATTVASAEGGRLYASRFSAGAGWGEATSLVSGVGYTWAPDVAMDSSGNALSVWMESPSGREPFTVRSSRFTAGGGWSAPEPVAQPNENAVLPWIAMSAAGRAVVVWEQGPDSAKKVYANRFDPQSGWSTPEQVSAGFGAELPVVAMDPQGNAIAIWVANSVQASYLTAGGSWTRPATLTSDRVKTTPYVRLDENGDAVAVWCVGPKVFASRFE